MPHALEEEVGITEYLSPEVQGFSGNFKERWQDFHVYEVDQGGVELHLSELITPGAVAAELKKNAEERREARSALGASFTFEPDAAAELDAALGQGNAQELQSFLQKQTVAEASSDAGEGAAEAPAFVDFSSAEIDGKEARKKAHAAILKHFGSFLNTETVELPEGARMLRIWMREAERKAKAPTPGSQAQTSGGKGKGKGKAKSKAKGKGGKGKGKDKQQDGQEKVESAFGTLRREGWPKDRPDYLYFRLYKENCNTGEAVSSIARCVGRSVKQFSFAGTKDKRAVTVQAICAHRLPADQLRRTVLHRLWDKRLRISDLEYRGERLRLGQLRGNRFKVVLRNIPPQADTDASAACVPEDGPEHCTLGQAFSAVKGGFLNYFGLQRFGTREVKTHQVGAAIIAGKWEEAVNLILGVYEGKAKRAAQESGGDRPSKLRRTDAGCVDAGQTTDALTIFLETGDAQKALDVMPRSQHLERCLLGARARGLPFAEALRQLPHQAVSLYAHAAQSFIWNSVLSRRIREFGRHPVVGDLVFASPNAEAFDGDTCEISDVMVKDSSNAPDEDADLSEEDVRKLPAVRALQNEEEAAAVTLADVVLPLPGSEVVFPSNLTGVYEELSQRLLGLSISDFSNCSIVQCATSESNCTIKSRDRNVHAMSMQCPHVHLLSIWFQVVRLV
ncbi:unnamed protein product [Effrenium voratum]|uniref:TRUD domain-containing protein n=1 Tax=Effrenium voratum TaxID=2562239 RepID=A0AA36HKX7_9DINO|nr:unnamed protein product [Effrenium voratum]CAJ1416404.1 unnamed protein product [Effrenium voratum]